MKWFDGPPIAVVDADRRNIIVHVRSVEAAARELVKWPKTKKRDKAATMVLRAHDGKGSAEAARKAFEQAAKEALMWVPYRGP